jgi:hypothetical protein
VGTLTPRRHPASQTDAPPQGFPNGQAVTAPTQWVISVGASAGAEALIVRRIFAEYVAGRAQNAIARDLEREDVPTLTPTGSWYATTVAGMLKNPL